MPTIIPSRLVDPDEHALVLPLAGPAAAAADVVRPDGRHVDRWVVIDAFEVSFDA